MKYLKSFKIFEELDIDHETNRRMESNTKSLVDMAKRYESDLTKKGLKVITKNSNSSDESRKLREEACDKVKQGDENVYGIMQWTGQTCQSFSIVSPEGGIEVLRKPTNSQDLTISYSETPGKMCTIDIYSTPRNGKSNYLQQDGEVLYTWDSYGKVAKGKLA
jgi:hypothetical protein